MKGITYTPDNLKATIEGRKTMTRRVEASLREINKEPERWHLSDIYQATGGNNKTWIWFTKDGEPGKPYTFMPRYLPGEEVFVKEAWRAWIPEGNWIVRYKLDNSTRLTNTTTDDLWSEDILTESKKWRSPLFMPEWAARYYQTFTGVSVQRLQAISYDDIIAEGWEGDNSSRYIPINPYVEDSDDIRRAARFWYQDLWNSISSKPTYSKRDDCYYSYPWEDIREVKEYQGKTWYVCGNPWLFVYSYRLER